MDYSNIELYKFIDFVFKKSCKDPMSIQLTVEEDKDLLDIFEMLMIIFTEGMKLKFGELDNNKNLIIVNLEELTDKDFIKMNQYFNSFGFQCFYQVVDYKDYSINNYLLDDIIIDTKNSKDKLSLINDNTKLSNIKYTIKTSNDLVYTIYFDFYKYI